MRYQVGMIITTKKPHVCKSNTWTVIRTGADIKIKCHGCGREVMMPKVELDKKIKQDK
ncbi:MAG: DUF951 domain-containing protein [Acholeplasmataceae bacterium]|jgi:hypothetical protein|nr:DUF951 domain-containing protein [Acholeplasmataceae bacterium]